MLGGHYNFVSDHTLVGGDRCVDIRRNFGIRSSYRSLPQTRPSAMPLPEWAIYIAAGILAFRESRLRLLCSSATKLFNC